MQQVKLTANMLDEKDHQRPDIDIDKINNFLSIFAPNHGKEEEEDLPFEEVNEEMEYYGSDDITGIRMSQYQAANVPDALGERIARLKRIAQTIEKKVIETADAHEVSENIEYKIDYKNSLNPSQYLAATTINGPVLVIAGAGSGKTRTVTYRTSYLIEKGTPPEQILLLTFTRKAANEIVRRTASLLQDPKVERIMRGTYHAFANHTLRKYANMIGIPSSFTIIDTIDAEDIIDLIRSEFKFSKKSKAFPRKSRVQKIISKSRNCDIPISEVIEKEYTGLLEFNDDIETIAFAYSKYKQANKIFDYDDLMEVLRNSLRDNMPFRRKIQSLYRYIMVDEFQDTNVVQKEIVDFIAGGARNIMIVGDDAQSIYAFRGANFENILTFPSTYPDCKVVKLVRNYRSNQDILNFTNAIANNATLGYKKSLFSENSNPFKPQICRFYDQQEEAEFIVSKILELREKDIPLNHIAVLYRSSYHGNFIQTELLKRSIPYVVVGGIKFIERRHVKDINAYLRIVQNPFDAVAWNRVLKLIPGVGKVTAGKIIQNIQANKGKMEFSQFEKKKFSSDLLKLQDALRSAMRPTITISSKIELLLKYYEPLLKTKEDDYDIRLQDIDVLIAMAGKYDDLEKFLSAFALDPPNAKFQDHNSPLIDESEDKPVTLSTIHSSKGLEWYCVFVPHLLDGLFPTTRSLKSLEDLEEERRLFYVACSRAKEQLFCTYPSYFNTWDNFLTMPCRFMVEIGNANYEVMDTGR